MGELRVQRLKTHKGKILIHKVPYQPRGHGGLVTFYKNIWVDVQQLKKYKVFREFRVELMNIEVEYGKKVENNNTSNTISGVLSEEANGLNMV